MIMLDAVMLMASVVLWNHLGLCEAVEKVLHYKFKIISCSKCGTFWAVLIYMLVMGAKIVVSVTAAFALSYTAIWFELLLGIMSRAYESAYDKISEAEAGQNKTD